ncbi:hypothetical protein DOY81_007712, partial [Sarcophaga bullata]
MRNQQSGNDIVKPVASKEFQPQIQNEGDSINNTWDYEEILKILGNVLSTYMWFPDLVNRSIAGSRTASNFTVCELINESYRRKPLNGTGAEEISTICDDTISSKTYIDTIIMGVTFLLGYAIQGAVLKFLGRKTVLFACLTLAAICGILFNVVTSITGVLVLFFLFILLPGLIISILIGASVDLVPTHLRGKVVSFGFVVGHVGLIVGTNLTAIMMEAHCNGFGKTQWILILIGGLLMSTSVFCQLSVGFIAMSSQCEFNMTQNEKGIMMTAYLA